MVFLQRSVINDHLKHLSSEPIEQAWHTYQNVFLPKITNIRSSKEEQYQYGFLDDLFVKVLGYTLNPSPDYNLIAEQKNLSDAKKADGAVLRDGKVIAVIELKSTKTRSMDKIVNQAFNYKHNHPECRYVITSNFEKLRLYVEHSDKYEEFHLFELDEHRFTLLFALLAKESIFDGVPLRLKNQSKLQEKNISNELYKKYATLRTNLFENILQNNPNIDKHILLEKTQTILDRMVFIFFGEDRGILPPNTIKAIIDHYEGDIEDRELWHFYKIYFNAINQGNVKLKIPEYNGGLFATDEVLDSLIIDSHVLDSSPLSLSAYDFNTDIDVNILGHIFENSLNDIEELKARIEDADFDAKKSKRKKDGVFYTPEYITKYIVDNTLGALCQAKREELGLDDIDIEVPKNPKKLNKTQTKQKEALEAYREYLLGLKILDPACGSGAFLNQALNYLLEEHSFIDEGIRTLMGGGVLGLYDVKKGILENNLYGVDINAEAVEIAKLSLWLRTVESGRKLNKLADKIKVGNSLINDLSVAPDAFVWEEEFAEVFEQGGFDVAIGNPPYVQLQSTGQVSDDLRAQNYQTFEKTGDLYVLFYELGNELLKEHGLLGFITSNKWMRARYGKRLRAYLSEKSNPKTLIDLGSGIFESATVDSNILISEKNKAQKCNLIAVALSDKKEFLGFESYTANRVNITQCSEDIWVISNPLELSIKKKIEDRGIPLKDFNINIFRGIQTGNNAVFIIDKKKKISLIKEDAKSIDLIKALLQGKDIKRYLSEFDEHYLLYVNDETEIKKYPAIYKYLLSHKDTLDKKKEVRENKMLWYALYRPAKKHISEFSNEKIFYNQIGNTIEFYLDTQKFYSNDKLYFITAQKLNLRYLLALLNSKPLQYYFSIIFNFGGGKGKEVFQHIPIPNSNTISETFLSKKADLMLTLNKTLQTKKQKFLKRVTDNFELEKLSKKIEAFYEHDFKTFVSELKKKKIKLSLVQQDEWEEHFESYQKELLSLQSQIGSTDKQIDKMVYELYGLSEEEIAVVEGE
jgi:type I restriction-modification system DNA methylase subunit